MLNITSHQENTNRNHNETLLHTHQDGYKQNNRCWQVYEETAILKHCWWKCKIHQKIVWQFIKRLNIELTYDPAVSLLPICPREMKTYVHTKTHKYSQQHFFNSQKTEISQCPSTDEWINCNITIKQNIIQPKKNDTLIFHST